MITQPHHMPERLALLSNSAADPFLTEGLLRGDEVHSGIDLAKVVEPLPEDDARWSVEPIRSLVDDAMFAFDEERTRADAWLAPRLHATLRLTRQEAADRRLWNHLALAVAPDYVVWRHLAEPSRGVAAARFQGPADRQCFSRLWWAAELFRDGPDYQPVEVACGNQDLIHTVLRKDLIDHRPTAQALVRLLKNGKVTTGREINGLSVAINAAGATVIYDAFAPDGSRDPACLRDWIDEAQTAPPVSRHVLPDGPDEDPVPEESVTALTDYFTELFETAPVRGRNKED
ncbi:DUF6339 family protein [Streptomyces jietaisiensis]|uniref:Uncharacterized protein n=2 Tax=Streptomyces griseoaurantiacus TaxID=68213 RepID=A0A7W2HVC4_9ACTN|nr:MULTISPECIES: DUF6339 family protein [Streptomyces]MBA5223016.1 hypothetical protein [Streptomyces griseoaurantiacus]MCF0087640.1 hypothetical protein [Streptomyces sp. MH192]MCF0099702.1 hypothetical protein [Streptomyces sp. MH191]MDX3088174.1 DUF6339 family protein [Streptomyces sp. ME12-02E]MDX3331530.1 DUF6339 family protein [Streptomyces sp. ME02-6978a]